MSGAADWREIEDLELFKATEELCDAIWELVETWRPLAQDTLGKQLVRAADSIGANLVEGDGRYHFKEKLNFCYVARGSARETRYWLRRAHRRRLITDAGHARLQESLSAILRWISTLIAERRRWANQVRETPEDYTA